MINYFHIGVVFGIGFIASVLILGLVLSLFFVIIMAAYHCMLKKKKRGLG